jgi:hypothetical protein
MHQMGKSYHWWHIDIRKPFAYEIIQNRHMPLIRVPTDEQSADIFSKALPFPQFERCLMGLMGGDLKSKRPGASGGGAEHNNKIQLGIALESSKVEPHRPFGGVFDRTAG